MKWLSRLAFLSGLLFGASDLYAAPLLVDLGPNKVVTGVTRTADGTSYLVGHQLNAQTGLQEAILVTIPAGASTFSVGLLPSLNGDPSVATKISPNGVNVTGYSNPLVGRDHGLFWDLSSGQVSDIGSLDNLTDTRGLAVSNNGVVAGFTNGTSVPVIWSSTSGLTPLPLDEFFAGSAFGISADGSVVGGEVTSASALHAAIWNASQLSTLENPNTLVGTVVALVRDVSADGSTFGGFVNFFDITLEQDSSQAAVWSGSNSEITLLTNADGTPFIGEVLGVSDNGYAVGTSANGGFIWQTGWVAPVLFNDWVLSEFGISIPTWVTAVHDVFFDGFGLVFALEGSAYYFSSAASNSTEVPEPSSIALLILSLTLLYSIKSRQKALVRK